MKVDTTVNEFVEKDSKQPTFMEWLTDLFDGIFVENLPFDYMKDLPSKYLYGLGFLTYVGFLFCIIFFFIQGSISFFLKYCSQPYIQGYRSATRDDFVSLTKETAECEAVPQEISGNYQADTQGYWEGDSNYNPSSAVYQIHFQKIKITGSQYKNILAAVREATLKVSKLSVNQDLLQNLLYWMEWQIILPYDQTINTFSMTGSPSAVFDR
jgi:hypothetical protein